MDVSIDSSFGLAEALRIVRGDVVSLVGAGGKTTALYGIVGELRRRNMTVITTTTTHMQTLEQATTMPPLVYAAEEADWRSTVKARVHRYGSATVVGVKLREDKLGGLEPDQIDTIRNLADCVILEADGARGRSLKAPALHEPVIPETTTLTVVLAGIDVLGKPLHDGFVHRVEEVSWLTGTAPGAPVTAETIALAMVDGYRSKVPSESRWLCFLNKVDDSGLEVAEEVGRALISAGAPEVVFGQAVRPNECFYRMSGVGSKA